VRHVRRSRPSPCGCHTCNYIGVIFHHRRRLRKG
jgi:hypothetical protein